MEANELPNPSNCYYTCNGRIVSSPEELVAARASGLPLRVWPRLPGGKGGFGSLLRSIGSQIDKTTNREMCRDLSGRRMRDVNNQKRLSEWASGAGARAAERQKRREEKRQRRRQLLASADGPAGHVMEDGSYLVEKERIVDSVFTAVKEAIGSSKKRPVASSGVEAASTSAGPSKPPKLAKKWLDADLADLEADGSSSGGGGGGSSTSSDDEESVESNNGAASSSGDTQKPPEEDSQKPPEEKDSQKPPEEDSQKPPEEDSQKPPEEDSQKPPKEDSQKPPEEEDTQKEASKSEQAQAADAKPVVELIDLSTIDSLNAAEALGLESLKDQLRWRGLKCGGSLRDRAQRLMAVRGLQPDQYPAALLAKPAKK